VPGDDEPPPSTVNLPGARAAQVGDGNTQYNCEGPITVVAGAHPAGPVCSVPQPRGDEIDRPELSGELVAALLSPEAGSVGVTTGLVGAGGFGKTTLARMVAADERVRQRFTDGQLWITVGGDTGGPSLAALITSTARLIDPTVPDVSDPLVAGA